MRKLIFLLCTTCIIFIEPAEVSASVSALSVSPAILESVVKPTLENTTKIMVINTTNFPLPIKGQVSAFLSDSNLPKSSEDTFNASSWFILDPADFILQPLEQKEVKVTILPPSGSEPGGHYATIYFQPLIPSEVLSTQSTVSLARVGVLTFLVVPGDIRENLEISNIEMYPWQTFGPIDVNFSIKNNGNIHILPTGQITIKDLLGNVVATLPLEPGIILPGTTKKLKLSWDKQLLFGRYSAVLTINYGNNHNPQVSDTKFIWILPWPIILIALVLLTLSYNIFIVNIGRLKLAILVLKGHDVHEAQSSPKSPSIHTRSSRGTHSPHSSSKGSHSR